MSDDPDLPGDASFEPVSDGIEIDGLGRMSMKMALPVADQQRILHNQLRYYELGLLRQGLPNRYNETRYR